VRCKLLVIGDAHVPTGFGRVVQSILERLPSRFDIHQLGINYRGDPHSARWPTYPAMLSGDPYGVPRVPELVGKTQPDLVFIVCDPWILTRYAEALAPFQQRVRTICYTPVEGTPIEPAITLGLRYIDRIVAYNRFGQTALVEAYRQAALQDSTIGKRSIEVIPHGVDTHLFHPVGADALESRTIARRKLLPNRADFQE
jgi:D-inositol-3-phosphate glycosyltransferase